METLQQVENKATAAPSCAAPAAKAGWLSWRNLLIGALILGAAALYFGWDWLVAAGVATVVLGLLPCLAMCALGLCMGRMGKKDAATPTSAALPPKEPAGEESAPHPPSKVEA